MVRMAFLLMVLLTCVANVQAAGTARDVIAAMPTIVAAGSFNVLCYHEARDEVRNYPDPFAVDSAALVRQFEWLRGNGYVPVSLDQIIAARQGGKALPPKAVLLSFDDAYLSFYTRVFPLLREFHYPAVLGIVGKWIENPRNGPVPAAAAYGETSAVLEASFPTWRQLREMADSGLVDMASHTYDLHRGLLANPQGNLQAAATTRRYDAGSGTYENEADWRTRVTADLARNSQLIERGTGRRPRAIVWPFGSYNQTLVNIAASQGMSIGLSLEEGINTPDVPLTALRRILLAHNPDLTAFAVQLRGPRYVEPVRAVQINLDDIYSIDPLRQEQNLSLLLDRILALKPGDVYLQATTDSNGDGIADMAYFPNRHLPVRGDLFARAAWQLTSRADVNVYALMPMAATGQSRQDMIEIYEDLASYANFAGLVFDDRSASTASQNHDLAPFTHQLLQHASQYRAPLKTVLATRNAQDVSTLAALYDHVALYEPGSQLLKKPDRERKLIYMLQGRTASGNTPLPDEQMRALQLGGVLNFGYVPPDILQGQPPFSMFAPAMSLREIPLPQRSGGQ